MNHCIGQTGSSLSGADGKKRNRCLITEYENALIRMPADRQIAHGGRRMINKKIYDEKQI